MSLLDQVLPPGTLAPAAALTPYDQAAAQLANAAPPERAGACTRIDWGLLGGSAAAIVVGTGMVFGAVILLGKPCPRQKPYQSLPDALRKAHVPYDASKLTAPQAGKPAAKGWVLEMWEWLAREKGSFAMNRLQKATLLVGGVLMLLNFAYPPWESWRLGPAGQMFVQKQIGRAPITDPPLSETFPLGAHARIDWGLLGASAAAIVVGTGVVFGAVILLGKPCRKD
jgi:hypothetical protein